VQSLVWLNRVYPVLSFCIVANFVDVFYFVSIHNKTKGGGYAKNMSELRDADER
jgi:hypothetical protein